MIKMKMDKFLYFGIFLASMNPNYEEASNQARRALLETEVVKNQVKMIQDKTEKKLYYYTGLTKDDVIYAIYAYPILTGKISSKPFKNFKYESSNKFVVRPELEYNLWNKDYSGKLYLTQEF